MIESVHCTTEPTRIFLHMYLENRFPEFLKSLVSNNVFIINKQTVTTLNFTYLWYKSPYLTTEYLHF